MLHETIAGEELLPRKSLHKSNKIKSGVFQMSGITLEKRIEGSQFFASPNHLAHWAFAPAIGLLQSVRPLMPAPAARTGGKIQVLCRRDDGRICRPGRCCSRGAQAAARDQRIAFRAGARRRHCAPLGSMGVKFYDVIGDTVCGSARSASLR